MTGRILTIEDLSPAGKRVFTRVDVNTPIDPHTGKLLEVNRIQDAAVTVRDLAEKAKVVVASHQGRPGRDDYVSLGDHAERLSQLMGKDVKFVEDVFGPEAIRMIKDLRVGEVLMLDNLRFTAEENMEFSPEAAAKTVLVQRLAPLFDMVVLDAFPTAHRAHPSIVGFHQLLPTCAGRLVNKEYKTLSRVLTVAKGPYTAVLGGSKVSDRLEAIETLVANGRADKVLLTGLIANVFLKAKSKINWPLGIEGEEKYVKTAESLLQDLPDTFEVPLDVAVERNGQRVETPVDQIQDSDRVYDIGPSTIDHYSRIIRSSGTVFMSGPPGLFEKEGFGVGTEALLMAMASSYSTTIVSGGHLRAALERFGIRDWIDHASTAGGALVLYLAGKRLPMIEALEKAAEKWAR